MGAPIPAAFADRYTSLTDQQRMRFDVQYQAEAKSPDIGLVCAILGVFYFYMGQVGKGVALILSCFFFVGLIWWVITMVNAKKEVNAHNTNVAQRILSGLV
jgi:TM2 domain-containing membrane protein YozV